MKIYIYLKCYKCGEPTSIHETGLNKADVYPCDKCFPIELNEEEIEE